MPNKNTYIFKNKISSVISIQLEIYGEEDKAWKILGNHVINTRDWELI